MPGSDRKCVHASETFPPRSIAECARTSEHDAQLPHTSAQLEKKLEMIMKIKQQISNEK
jgi:hypothetical protein